MQRWLYGEAIGGLKTVSAEAEPEKLVLTMGFRGSVWSGPCADAWLRQELDHRSWSFGMIRRFPRVTSCLLLENPLWR